MSFWSLFYSLHLDLIDYSKKIAKFTKKAIVQNKELLVLGGDHAAAIGTWSGVASALLHRGPIGLVWIGKIFAIFT